MTGKPGGEPPISNCCKRALAVKTQSLQSCEERCLICAYWARSVTSEEAPMRTLPHFRTHDERYFHSHPLHGTFSLITSLVMAMLIVLLLVMSAK